MWIKVSRISYSEMHVKMVLQPYSQLLYQLCNQAVSPQLQDYLS